MCAMRFGQPPCAHALYVIPGPARPEGLSIVGAIHCYAAAIEHELDRLALVRQAGGAGDPLSGHVLLPVANSIEDAATCALVSQFVFTSCTIAFAGSVRRRTQDSHQVHRRESKACAARAEPAR